jgi:type IV secretory pathway VirB3-like protein
MTIFIIVAAIAIFDAFAGVMATLAFWASQVFTGNVTSFRDVMVALAIGLAWVGPSLFAALLRDVIGRDFASRNAAGRDPIQVLGILGSALVGSSVFYLGHALVNSVIYTEQLIREISLVQIAIIAGALLVRGFADLIVLASTKTVETRDESFYIARVNSPVTAFAIIAIIYAFVFIWTENAQNSFFVAILFALPYFFSFIRFGAIKLIKSDRIPRNILIESAVISGVTFIVFRQISTQPLLIDQRAFLMLLLAGIAPVLHAIYSAIYSSNEEKFSFEENSEIIKP